VLTHARDDFHAAGYLLALLVDAWRESGMEVVILRGIDPYVEADVLIQHVSFTVIPRDYEAFTRRFPIVINGGVHDISKRRISGNLIGAGDSYQGEVIVKTDRNCGGCAERQGKRRGLMYRAVNRIIPWSWSGRFSTKPYPIFSSPAMVPRPVWLNRRLVVEKFLPEREGDGYCLRQWVFFGDRGINQRVFSQDPVVKAQNVIHREYDVPVPDALRAIRSKLGFDYGKFDYVIANGDVALLDANRTPTSSRGNPSPRLAAFVSELAPGLDSFMTSAGQTI
jgi:hypothetical protein